MRYAVHARDARPLAMLDFYTAACELDPYDRLIDWTRQVREKNVSRVVDNPHALMLP